MLKEVKEPLNLLGHLILLDDGHEMNGKLLFILPVLAYRRCVYRPAGTV